jgi:hypothetical protein
VPLIGRESHTIGDAEAIENFSDRAIRVKSQETTISSNRAGENSSFRIGDDIVEAIVPRT